MPDKVTSSHSGIVSELVGTQSLVESHIESTASTASTASTVPIKAMQPHELSAEILAQQAKPTQIKVEEHVEHGTESLAATVTHLDSTTTLLKNTLQALSEALKHTYLADTMAMTLSVQLRECINGEDAEARNASLKQLKHNLKAAQEAGVDESILQSTLELGEKFCKQSLSPKDAEQIYDDINEYVFSFLDSNRIENVVSRLCTKLGSDDDAKSFSKEISELILLFKSYTPALHIMEHKVSGADLRELLLSMRTAQESNGEESNGEEEILDFMAKLDVIFMPHQKLRNKLLSVKKDFYQNLQKETLPIEGHTDLSEQINNLHKLRANCCLITQFLPKTHEYRQDLLGLSHENLREIINNRSLRIYKNIPDLLLFNTYVQLVEFANLDVSAALDALPQDWLFTIEEMNNALQRGITDRKQIKTAANILHSQALGRVAKDTLARNLAKYRSDAGAQHSEKHLRILAKRFLGVKNADEMSVNDIISTFYNQSGARYAGPSGLHSAMQAIRATQDGRTVELEKVFAAMTAAQKPISITRFGDVAPEKTRGETQAITTLYVQRLLTRSVTELSLADLASLGASASREQFSTDQGIIDFVENTWAVSAMANNSDWVTGILLASYEKALENTGGTNSLTYTELQEVTLENIKVQQNRSPIEIAELLKNLNVVKQDLKIVLKEGRTRRALHAKSDAAGQILKDLYKQFIACTAPIIVNATGKERMLAFDKGVISAGAISVEGDERISTHSHSTEALRQAILAILTGSSITMQTDREGDWQKYICPVDAAHAALMFCHDSETDSAERMGDMFKRALSTPSADDMESIRDDFASITGSIDRQKAEMSEIVKTVMKPLLLSDTFNRKVLPLALLKAQYICNVGTLEELYKVDAMERQMALTQAFQDFTEHLPDATLLAECIDYLHDAIHPLIVSTVSFYSDSLYSFISVAMQYLHRISSNKQKYLHAEREAIRNDAAKIVEELPNDTGIFLSHQATASIPIAVVGAMSLGVDGGKEDGLALWRDASGQIHVSMSEKVLAKISISAGKQFKFLKLAGTTAVEGSGGRTLTMDFPNDENCVEFLTKFLANEKFERPLDLCANAQIGSSYELKSTLSGVASVGQEFSVTEPSLGPDLSSSTISPPDIAARGVRKDFEDAKTADTITVGVFTAKAGFEVSSDIVRHVIENGEKRIIRTEFSLAAKASGSVSLTASPIMEIDLGVEPLASAKVTRDILEGEVFSAVATASSSVTYNSNSIRASGSVGLSMKQQISEVRSLNGESLLGAYCKLSRQFDEKTGVWEVRKYCADVGLKDEKVIGEILEAVKNLQGKSFVLDVENKMVPQALAICMDNTKAIQHLSLQDPANYSFKRAFLRTVSGVAEDSTGIGIFTVKTSRKKESTRAFSA